MKKIIYGLTILLALFSFSCKNGLNVPNVAQNTQETYLTFSFDCVDSRVISPNYPTYSKIMLYSQVCSEDEDNQNEIKLLNTWNNADSSTVSITKIVIEPGTYNFTVELYSDGKLSQIGTKKDFTITEGKNTLSIKTDWNKNGIGKTNVKLCWYEDSRIGKVEAGLFTIASNGEMTYPGYELEELAIQQNTEDEYDNYLYVDYIKDNIPCGYYYIRFNFYSPDGDYLNTFEDVLKIYPGLESPHKETLLNINSIYLINYSFDLLYA